MGKRRVGNRLIVIDRCVGLNVSIMLGIYIGAYLLLYSTRSIYYLWYNRSNVRYVNMLYYIHVYKKRGKWFKQVLQSINLAEVAKPMGVNLYRPNNLGL